ncbi:LysE family translocator [Xanthomonas campestris]|uniref:LysE family translocator n=1 Tax=Xanthomonas campestris pv. papavericola TaxID=487881 RepID=A0AAJ2X6Z2_XANCA|nr:LysE family translocator [Xanthomonas campestris]MEC3889674.1 LysE family translocator [Xanthomonas campestris pv. papavericola]
MVHFKPTIAVILSDQLQALLPAYLAYVVTIASPGPSNMAILELALRRGRDAALALAAGVVTVSWTWALLAATSLSAVLFRHPWLLDGVKTVGGLYLLWLGWRAASAAQRSGIHEASERSPETRGLASLYARGVLMHLANPKAVIGWLAVLSLGLTRSSVPSTPWLIVAGCAVLSVLVFGGYAIAFSTPAPVRVYVRARRPIQVAVAAVFLVTGVSLLASSINHVRFWSKTDKLMHREVLPAKHVTPPARLQWVDQKRHSTSE